MAKCKYIYIYIFIFFLKFIFVGKIKVKSFINIPYSIQTLDHYYLKLIQINAVINAKEERYSNKFKSFRFHRLYKL